jgi:hypothetical protein
VARSTLLGNELEEWMKKLVAVALLVSTGCASVAHQTTQQIPVASEPAGAAVTVACGDVHNDARLVTPTVVTVHRKPAHCLIDIAKEGHAPHQVRLDRQLSGWYLGNILIGGIIGLVVDAANGAMWNRSPGKVSVTLAPAVADAEK